MQLPVHEFVFPPSLHNFFRVDTVFRLQVFKAKSDVAGFDDLPITASTSTSQNIYAAGD